jgi:glucokinase
MGPTSNYFLGVDLGGTTVGIGIVSDEGNLVAYTSMATEVNRGPHHVVSVIGKAARNLIGVFGGGILRAGMGAPGPLDTRTGVVYEMPNLGWERVPLRSMLEEEIGIRTYLDNDANAAAFGEWWVGAGVGAHALVCFTLGTGIGGGIVIDGEVYRGVSDAAGEFGHMIIQPGGRACHCGKSGCLEAYASATAISARAGELARAGRAPALLDLAGGDVSSLTSQLVARAAQNGDEAARRVMEEAIEYLAIGVSNVMNALNPDVVVIGGGVAEAGDILFAPLAERIRELTFEVVDSAAKIVPAMLGSRAGTVGAAGIAMRRGEGPE